MRDKIHDAGNGKMSCADSIAEARRMSDFLLHREFRGPGDTIEAAAHRAEQRWGAPASILQRLRHRDVTDMLLSNWVRLKAAYEAAAEHSRKAADHQEHLAREAGLNAANSKLYAMASSLAGEKGAAE